MRKPHKLKPGWLYLVILIAAPTLVLYPPFEGAPEEPPPPEHIKTANPSEPAEAYGLSSEQHPFPEGLIRKGEELEHRIQWNGIPAGRTLLRVLEKEPTPDTEEPVCWRVRMDTRSSRALSVFYPVRDKAISIIDEKTGFSRFFKIQKREGEYAFTERIRFDYSLLAMKASYDYELDRDGQWRLCPDIKLTKRVLDPLCALYYLRARTDLNGENKQGIVLPICTDRRVWETRIIPIGVEFLSVPGLAKPQRCLQIKPDCRFNGLFQRRGEMWIWLHEATRVPIKMSVESPIGDCEVFLDRHVNSPLDRVL